MYVNDRVSMQVTKSLALSSELTGAMVCIRGQAIGSLLSLPGDRKMTIGRDPNVCNYVISDSKVSRKHLDITYVGTLNKYLVVDYSSNGTFLQDGTRLQNNMEYYLSPGAELQLGTGNNIYKLR